MTTQLTTKPANYTRTFKFLDAKRNLCTASVEITNRNGYPEFTASGEYNGSMGQCFDSVVPDNDSQKQFIKLWHKWHLNSRTKKLPIDFENTLTNLIDDIENLEEEKKGETIKDLADNELIAFIEDKTIFTGRDAELCAALVKMFDLTANDLDDIEINDTNVTVQGTDYIAGNDSEMDDKWDEDLDNYLDECVLPDLPETAQRYFDSEAWKKDARYDGRGHSLNRYDGGEEEQTINGTTYYAYKQ